MTTADFSALGHEYEVMEKIHESGLESIYKIRHRLLDETRAVRIVLPDPDTDPKLMERLQVEARSTVLLRHRNTVELYDFSITPEGQALIVMEYIDGVNLRTLREDRGPLPTSQILEIVLQALEALDFLHAAGFVHRNLSPEGIMLTRDMEGQPLVKIIDLGLVKSLQDGQQVTTLEMFLGKTRYASPEQFSESEVVAQSDLYSFGVVLYELLTGELPIQGKDLFSFVDGHLHHPPRSFDETDPEGRIPEELRNIVLWTLAKDPADRPQSAEQLAQRFRSFEEQRDRHDEDAAGAGDDTMILESESASPPPAEDAASDPHETVVLPAEIGHRERTATVTDDEVRPPETPEPPTPTVEMPLTATPDTDSVPVEDTVTVGIQSRADGPAEDPGATPRAPMVLPTGEDPAGHTAPIPTGSASAGEVRPSEAPEAEVETDDPDTEPYGFEAVATPATDTYAEAEEPVPSEEPETEPYGFGSVAEPATDTYAEEPDVVPEEPDVVPEEPETERLVFEPRPDMESPATEPAPPARPEDTEYAHPAYRPPLDFRPPATPAEDEAPSPEPAETFRSRPIWPWVIAAAALVAVVAGAAYQHFRLQRTVPSRVSDLVSPGDATPKPPATESEPPGTDLEPPEAKPELTEPPKIELAPGAPGIDVGPRPTEGAPGEELLELEPESEPPEEVGDPDLPRSAVVRDPRTGLTWLSSDNARDVDWASAKAFCARNTAGSQGDWRLPTVSELRSIYDRESQNQMRTRLGIEISDFFVWSSQGSSGQAQYFTFMNGESGHLDQATSDRQRAICVSGG